MLAYVVINSIEATLLICLAFGVARDLIATPCLHALCGDDPGAFGHGMHRMRRCRLQRSRDKLRLWIVSHIKLYFFRSLDTTKYGYNGQ